ncbi:helix-turn-helix domain-containing protein [Paracoccus sp. CPCC 101403]|uniref:Helix-turn-helix domain-containing protein n=1 Tax=Paracoccus broussonetiae TaxID=3075834 RepID=A0ABU3E7X1_9RHOB|nr:helix-turn-helix domain-containing protein [Paracoccus sp. CPCC 101403]MDT1060313.1 helix-turn-helix domain-containing protein [Paracoccus sp. CPCC 101403]
MSNAYLNAAWRLVGLSSTQRLVLVYLADLVNPEGVGWSKLPTIMARTGLSDRAIQKAVQHFENEGLVTVQRSGGRGIANCYTLNFAPIARPNDPADQPELIHRNGDIAQPDGDQNPERGSENPERGSQNPERGSPQPYITKINPFAPATEAVDKSPPLPPPKPHLSFEDRQRILADVLGRKAENPAPIPDPVSLSSTLLTDQPITEGFLQ